MSSSCWARREFLETSLRTRRAVAAAPAVLQAQNSQGEPRGCELLIKNQELRMELESATAQEKEKQDG